MNILPRSITDGQSIMPSLNQLKVSKSTFESLIERNQINLTQRQISLFSIDQMARISL